MSVYTDDFSTDPAARISAAAGTWVWDGAGALLQTDGGTDQHFAFHSSWPTLAVDAFDAGAQVTLTEDPSGRKHLGLFLQSDGPGATGFRVTHLDNTWAVDRWENGGYVGGTSIGLIVESVPWNVGDTKTLRVVRKDEIWHLFVNGTCELSWHDDTYSALRLGYHSYGSKVRIDNAYQADSPVTPVDLSGVTFTDDYSTDPAPRLISVNGSNYGYAWDGSGALLQTNDASTAQWVVEGPWLRTGYSVVEADMTLLTDQSNRKHLGLFMQTNADAIGYRVAHIDGGWQVYRYNDGGASASVDDPWALGQTKHLKLELAWPYIRLFVDGQMLIESDLRTYQQRNDALIARAGYFTYGNTARMDNLRSSSAWPSTDIAVQLGQVSETDQARPLSVDVAQEGTGYGEGGYGQGPYGGDEAGITIPLERVTENDTARPLQVGVAEPVGPITIALQAVIEHDTARALDVQMEGEGPGFDVEGNTSSIGVGVASGYLVLPPTITVNIPEPVLQHAPTSVVVYVSGPAQGELVSFSIDGVYIQSEEMKATGFIGPVQLPVGIDPTLPTNVPHYYAAGEHTVTAATTTGMGEATFTLVSDGPEYPPDYGTDDPPVHVPESGTGAVRRWVMQDVQPGGLGSWVMPFNPRTMSPLPFEKSNLAAVHTTADTGQFHVTDAAERPHAWSFQGIAFDEETVQKLRAYAGLNRRWYLQDHRGRAWIITILQAELIPRKRHYDNALADQEHDYTVNALIYSVDWKPVEVP